MKWLSVNDGGHGHIVAAALEGVGRPGQLLDTHSFVRVGHLGLNVIEKSLASVLEKFALLLR